MAIAASSRLLILLVHAMITHTYLCYKGKFTDCVPTVDPAGLAISSSLRADARVFAQASRNANDAISLLSVAEGALDALSTITIRQRELSQQAANGALSHQQRAALHEEANALVEEFNRIVGSASFNGINVLSGAGTDLSVQLGYGASGALSVALGNGLARTIGDGTFGTATSIPNGSASAHDVMTADFNNDGYLDYSIGYSGGIQTFLGNGNGTFKAGIVSSVPATPKYAIDHADINGDGNEDIMAVNSTGTTFSILLGNGNGTFNASVSYNAGFAGNIFRGYLADVNNDGYADAVNIAISSGVRIGVALANANGTFNAATSFVLPSIASSDTATVADFDLDGNLDVAVGDFSSTTISIAYGAGNGTFGTIRNVNTGAGTVGGRINSGDLNNDGISDIIAVDSGNSRVSILIGNGDGSFKASVSYTGGVLALMSIGDLNGDGINDLAFSDNGGARVRVMLNNGDGTFKATTSYATTTGFSNALGLGDFNEDGVLDIVSPNFGAASTSLLLGNTQRSTSIAHIDLTSQEAARDSMAIIDSTLDRISKELGTIGAFRSRLEIAYNNARNIEVNSLAAASRITDVDVAEEVAKMTITAIRQNAATAILAQANISPKLALTLLNSE